MDFIMAVPILLSHGPLLLPPHTAPDYIKIKPRFPICKSHFQILSDSIHFVHCCNCTVPATDTHPIC
uniref:Uncharacterized protein n=1 Tax=Arundo donax TaxID=35708 RepID=A0A0A9HMF2_ARUDO